ncbi:MAG: methyl-accepting chemotaxis protein [Paracoccaceae bacterium]|jgi:methyl-accepting chemotaxis protein
MTGATHVKPPHRKAPARLSRAIALGVCAAIITAVALVTAMSAKMMGDVAHKGFARDTQIITELQALGAGGGIRFSKGDLLTEQFAAFRNTQSDWLIAMGAWNAEGEPIAVVGEMPEAAEALALAAMRDAKTVISADGLMQAVPSRFGKTNDVVGAVVAQWSDATASASINDAAVMVGLSGLGVAAAFGVLAVWLLQRGLARPLAALASTVTRLAAGENAAIDGIERKDEIGALSRALTEIYANGLRSARVRSALDSSSARVLIADDEGKITFASAALVKLLTAQASSIQRDVAGFDPDALIGAPLSRLGTPIQRLAENARAAQTERMTLGDMQLDLTASPVVDADGARIGSVVEWTDLTATLRLERDIDTSVAAFAEGDFDKRVQVSADDGRLGVVATRLNQVGEIMATFVSEIEAAAAAIAEGDLTHRMSAAHKGRFHDVTSALTDAMAGLSDLVGQIKRTEAAIQDALGEVESGSSDLARRAEQQAGALGETAASMEEMAASVTATATNAVSASELARQARGRAQQGREVVSDAVTAMSGIERSSKRINDIISVIDGIAFQTNLLALNAAVEAARAGEAGKGFSVVASEVRTLAQRSSEAARDISGLITESGGNISIGVGLVNSTGAALGGILDAIEQVSSTIDDISEASREQSQGLDGINGSLSSMDEMTRRNATLAVNSAEAAARLRDEAMQLGTLVGRFQTDDGAPARHRAAA